jgi:hypothetical protein
MPEEPINYPNYSACYTCALPQCQARPCPYRRGRVKSDPRPSQVERGALWKAFLAFYYSAMQDGSLPTGLTPLQAVFSSISFPAPPFLDLQNFADAICAIIWFAPPFEKCGGYQCSRLWTAVIQALQVSGHTFGHVSDDPESDRGAKDRQGTSLSKRFKAD